MQRKHLCAWTIAAALTMGMAGAHAQGKHTDDHTKGQVPFGPSEKMPLEQPGAKPGVPVMSPK